MAATARNLVSGGGTVSTTLSSENLTFSQSQDLLWGAAVVLSDGQQFTIRDGAGYRLGRGPAGDRDRLRQDLPDL
jgi:hypothetical protein